MAEHEGGGITAGTGDEGFGGFDGMPARGEDTEALGLEETDGGVVGAEAVVPIADDDVLGDDIDGIASLMEDLG